MCKKIISIVVLIVFVLFQFCGLYSYALTPYEGEVENPVLQEVTTDSITLVPFEGYEYSKDGMIWQDSNVFNNLTVATTYEMYQRVKATEEVDKSPKSDALEVTTKKYENNNNPYSPVLYMCTDTTIILKTYNGYEYSIDGENFQDSTTFSNLNSNTAYTFYQRIKETSDTYASRTSNPKVFYTLKKDNTTEPEIIHVEEITATSVTLVLLEGYEYSIDGSNFQDSNSFVGLTPNTEYTFYQRIKETEEFLAGSTATKSIKTIKYTNNNSVDAPIIETYTANDVTLKKLDILEYSKDQENWQDSSIFNDLTPETEYIFYQRIKETDDTYASNSSEGLNIRTKKENTTIPVKPEIADVTENIVTLKYVEGYEYSINQGTTWQDSNVFTKLEPLTEYTFVQRIKTDNIFGYSVISEMSEIARTAQILTITNLPDDYTPIYTMDEIPKGVGSSYTTDEYQKALEELRKKYILMNDIEYVNPSNETFSLISLPLEGVIDGNGYSLLNFNRSLVDLNNGIIKNLCIDYGINGEYSNRYYGLVGTNNGQIINCHVKGDLYGDSRL